MDWVKEDLLELKFIETSKNCADALTEQLDRTLYHLHFDVLMGINKPLHVDFTRTLSTHHSGCSHSQDHSSRGGGGV